MRLLRYLTFSNVIALAALFIALGGAAYAGSKLNGKNIVNASIGGGKLKNETITGNKIKKGTITSAQIQEGSINSSAINLSTLGTVPSANSATTATSAENAIHANSAAQATAADNAVHAKEADSATTAGDAKTLEGASRAELTVSCRTETEFYGGMCWDEANRQAKLWINAVKDCGDEGGRLPMIGELIAFVGRPGIQVVGQTWSGDLADVNGAEEEALTSDELGRDKASAGLLSYRCVFPQTN